LFKKRIVLDATHTVLHTDDFCAPVAFLVVDACHLEDKTPEELEKDAALIERLKQDHLNQCKLSPTPSETIPFILEKKDPKLLKSGTTMIYGFQGQYYLSGITAYTPIDGVVSLHPLAGKENQKELSIAEEVDACFERVKILLLTQKMTLEDVCFVHLYVHDMKEFGLINTEYCRHFGSRNPPSRSCIEIKRLKLAKTRILMDCFAIQGSGVAKMDKENIHRDVLHIQSISSWAPTCIGPYSQANIVGRVVFLNRGTFSD
jgi:diphthine-ammonia ligase